MFFDGIMVFTEPAFLFLYLPFLLAANFAVRKQWRNPLLTLASLLFYSMGEPKFVPVLVASCLFNYAAALGWIAAGGNEVLVCG
jgi:alginate O-acetyltransferase complex protein AlgI